MHAIALVDDRLQWQDGPSLGDLSAGQVRIRVAWAGVNRADLQQRAGRYPPPPGASEILGLEVSGTVVETGPGTTTRRVDERVCALLTGGGYAEEVVVDERQVLPLPEGFDLRRGAALPEAFTTAWLNLFMEGGLRRGERVLLHAAASGVGTAAIQLCRVFGHPCFVTAGSAEKLAACRELGAEAGWNRHDGSFVEAVKAWGGADLILDPVGASYLADNQQVLKVDGRLVLIGLMGGRRAELDMGRMLMKRQRLIGSTLRARPPEGKGRILAALEAEVWPRLTSGEIRVLIDHTWPIAEADAAHAHMQRDANIGKVVLAVSGEV